MYDRRPDVTDEDLGIRAFQVKKAKAVERAIERIRHNLDASWRELNDEEIEELEWILGELWALVARQDWNDLAFGHLTMSDVVKLLTLSSQLRRHARPSTDILHEAEAVVRGGEAAQG